MNKDYGFNTVNYDNDTSIETLETGDGKTQFTDILHNDKTVAIGIGHGKYLGIGEKEEHNKTLDSSMNIKWQIKFDNQKSVDAMIETLLRVKNQLADI